MSRAAATSHALDADPTLEAQTRVADQVGRLMEFWGFKRNLGRAWTVLFFSPEPLGAAELSERLHLSASAVSLSLGELLRWGAVRKTWVPGERRDFFEVETSIWKLVTRVVQQRELSLVRESAEVFADAEQVIRDALVGAEGDRRAALELVRRRLGRLRLLARAGEQMLRAVVAGRALDPADVRTAASPPGGQE